MISSIQNNIEQIEQVQPMQIGSEVMLANVSQSVLVSQLESGSVINSLKKQEVLMDRIQDLPASNDQERLIKTLANQAGIFTVQQMAENSQRQALTSIKALPEVDREEISKLYFTTKFRQHIQWYQDALIVASSKKNKQYSLSMWIFEILPFCQHDFTRAAPVMVKQVLEKKIPAKSAIPGAEYLYQYLKFLTSEDCGPKYWYKSDEELFNKVMEVLAPYQQETTSYAEKLSVVFQNIPGMDSKFPNITEKHSFFVDYIGRAISRDLTGVVAAMNNKGKAAISTGGESPQMIGDAIEQFTIDEISFADPSTWLYPVDYFYGPSIRNSIRPSMMDFYTRNVFEAQNYMFYDTDNRQKFSDQWWLTQPGEIAAQDKTAIANDFQFVHKRGNKTIPRNTYAFIKPNAVDKESVIYHAPCAKGIFYRNHADPVQTKPRIEWELADPVHKLQPQAELEFWATVDIIPAIKLMHAVGLIGCLDINKVNLKLADLFRVDEAAQLHALGYRYNLEDPYSMEQTQSRFLSDINNAVPTWNMREQERRAAYTATEAQLRVATGAHQADIDDADKLLAFLSIQQHHRNTSPGLWKWTNLNADVSAQEVLNAIKLFRETFITYKKMLQAGYTYKQLELTYLDMFAALEDGPRLETQNLDYNQLKSSIQMEIRSFVNEEYSKKFSQIQGLFTKSLGIFSDAVATIKKEQEAQTKIIREMNSLSRGIWDRQQKYVEDKFSGVFANKYKMTDNFYTNDLKLNYLRELMIDNIGLSMGSQSAAHVIIDHIKTKQQIPTKDQLQQMASDLSEMKQIQQQTGHLPDKKEFKKIVKEFSAHMIDGEIVKSTPKKLKDLHSAFGQDPNLMPASSSATKKKKKNKKKVDPQNKPDFKKDQKSDSEDSDEAPQDKSKQGRKNQSRKEERKQGNVSKQKNQSTGQSGNQSEKINTEYSIEKPMGLFNQKHFMPTLQGWKGKFGSRCPDQWVNCFGQTYTDTLANLGIPYPKDGMMRSDGRDPQTWMSNEMMLGHVSPGYMLKQTLAWAPLGYHKSKKQFRDGVLEASRFESHIQKIKGSSQPLGSKVVKQEESKKKSPSVKKERKASQKKSNHEKGMGKLQQSMNKLLKHIK